MTTCICPSPHPGECPWARVESEDEVKVGMALLFNPCGACGKAETTMVMAVQPAEPFVLSGGRYLPSTSKLAVRLEGSCGFARPTTKRWQIGSCIADGKVYRLRDLPPEQAEETSAPVKKETT